MISSEFNLTVKLIRNAAGSFNNRIVGLRIDGGTYLLCFSRPALLFAMHQRVERIKLLYANGAITGHIKAYNT